MFKLGLRVTSSTLSIDSYDPEIESISGRPLASEYSIVPVLTVILICTSSFPLPAIAPVKEIEALPPSTARQVQLSLPLDSRRPVGLMSAATFSASTSHVAPAVGPSLGRSRPASFQPPSDAPSEGAAPRLES